MTENALRERLSQVRCFMLDMDGTFYLGDRLLEGSLDFLDALERTGRRALFVTNNSSKSAGKYVEKLSRMGVREPFLNVLTSGQATAMKARLLYPGKRAFVLGNEYLFEELQEYGLEIDQQRPDYVIIGYDTMGTETTADDVLIFMDSDDVCDHCQDGYAVASAEEFFHTWRDIGALPLDQRIQQYLIAYPPDFKPREE